jgi:uncharacterized protein YhbP (UPF0306 family)
VVAATIPMGTHQRSAQEEKQMASLKGTKTHKNLKEAFAGESQANRSLYFARSPMSKVSRRSRAYSATPPKVKPATPTVIWIT